jgi:hypothetical protein
MIRGRFGNTTGRPYIEGRLVLLKFNLIANISFLADTGANSTSIMQMDGMRMPIPYDQLKNPNQSYGVGGIDTEYSEDALIAFLDKSGTLYVYNVEVGILEKSPDIMTCPSLLGRDIMQRWSFLYDFPNGSVCATVNTADWRFDTNPNTMPYLSRPTDPAPVLP